MPEVAFHNLGLIDYKEAWDLQERLFKSIIDQKIQNRKIPEAEREITPNFLLFCEHPHVYTMGKSGKPENLLVNDEELRQINATYYKINRGGDITYHGPGQLVGYPIFDLDHFFTDIHKYLRFLEEAVIRTLADFGVTAGRVEGLTGVWLDGDDPERARKICALGVKCSRWVTMHGFAFNLFSKMSYFENIVPCGIDDKAVTSLHLEVERPPTISTVSERMRHHLSEIFGFNYA